MAPFTLNPETDTPAHISSSLVPAQKKDKFLQHNFSTGLDRALWARFPSPFFSATATVGVILQLLYNKYYCRSLGRPQVAYMPFFLLNAFLQHIAMLICKPLFALQKSKSEEVITLEETRRFDLYNYFWYNIKKRLLTFRVKDPPA